LLFKRLDLSLSIMQIISFWADTDPLPLLSLRQSPVGATRCRGQRQADCRPSLACDVVTGLHRVGASVKRGPWPR
jgi:hypothetical protein